LGSVGFQEGLAGETSFTKAKQWYLRASEKGHPEAQNNLGLLFANGQVLVATTAVAGVSAKVAVVVELFANY
jgi:TPR repeat protein